MEITEKVRNDRGRLIGELQKLMQQSDEIERRIDRTRGAISYIDELLKHGSED